VKDIEFRGKSIPLKSEKLRESFLAIQQTTYELERKQQRQQQQKESSKVDQNEALMTAFDQNFIAHNDCLRILKEEFSALSSESAQRKSEIQKDVLLMLQDYVTISKLKKTVERNLLLVQSLQNRFNSSRENTEKSEGEKQKPVRPDDLVRIYETLIQNMMESEELREKTDIEQGKEIAANILLFQALRCYYIGMSYMLAQKWAESGTVFEGTTKIVNSAIDSFRQLTSKHQSELDQLAQLKEKIRSEHSVLRARALLAATPVTPPSGNSEMLSDVNKLDSSFLAKKHLIEFPPEYEAIHCRPLLFDLAMLSCEFPSLDSRKKPKKKLFGWF